MNKSICKKTLVLIVGETGAGKDTVVNNLPYHKVISYKTGPLRDSDVEGGTHFFISDEKMDELEKRDDLISWTKTGDIRYCATEDQLKDDVTIYIINPDGVRWFRENYKGDTLNIIVIGLYLDLETRKERCKVRSDFNTVFESRVNAETSDFEKFISNGEFDYIIKNVDSKKTSLIIHDIIYNEIMNNDNVDYVKAVIEYRLARQAREVL